NSVDVVFAMHKNPELQRVVKGVLGNLANVTLVDSPDYREFANLLARCTFLVTDSGGLQEEAAALGKPVLVMRNCTERPEGVETGILKLIGSRQGDIINHIITLLTNEAEYKRMAQASNPFGDGKAASRIRRIVEEQLI